MADNRKQLGTDYVVFINTGTDVAPVWKVALCQTTATVNTPMEVIDASSKCGPDSMIDNGIETVEFEGQILQKDDDNVNHMSLFELRQLMRTKDLVQFKLGPKGETLEDDGKIIYDFDGYITSISDTYPNKEVATSSVSVSVSGEIEESEFVFTT
jgi:hypothetical protein